MTTRRPLTRTQRVRIFDRHRGICHWCHQKIRVADAWDIDHVKPLWLNGDDTPDNMAPIHLDPCHREKSGEEAPIRAKTDRQRANHLGIPKPGPKLPAGRNSAVKKKINGKVVSRPERSEDHRRVMAAFPNWRGE